jgi:Glycosyl transferase family group 2
VQTAQGYEDAQTCWVRRAAAQQEALLYDTILESYSVAGHVPLCGTNFVMRRAALDAVGGFDETCLSEDLSTGHAMHVAGWRSVYLREMLAAGLAPEDLFAYWRQQTRWATGNTQLLLRLLGSPGRGGWRLWAGAVWSSGFYVVACAIGLLAVLPVVPLLVERLAGVGAPHPALGPLGLLGLSVYPLYVLVVLFPYLNMALRGYAVRDLLLVQGLLAVSAPRYARAVLRAIFPGGTVFYGTRHVGRAGHLWPQVLVWLACLAAGALALDAALRSPAGASGWVLYGWLAFYGAAIGHLPLFALEARAVPAVKPAGVSDIPSLRSARSK